MSIRFQIERSGLLAGAIGLLLSAFILPLVAAEEMTIDQYIDDARPYLNLSCEGAWYESHENADEYVAIINRFVAIIFINHSFDVQQIADAPEADQEKLRVLFYNEVGKRCGEDPQKLLAGVVERSMVYAFDQMK